MHNDSNRVANASQTIRLPTFCDSLYTIDQIPDVVRDERELETLHYVVKLVLIFVLKCCHRVTCQCTTKSAHVKYLLSKIRHLK